MNILIAPFVGVFVFLLSINAAVGRDIPEFTPNVVDLANALSLNDIEEVNQALAQVRARADIWGAVFIVPNLDGESIESLSERAFRKWKLGARKKDNGLLLVLSISERRSRFEVGYGLEGEITDLYSMRALEKVLRPQMKKGEIRTAIISSFNYLAGIRSKNPYFKKDPIASAVDRSWYEDPKVQRGLVALLVFYLLVWICRPIAQLMSLLLARRLAAKYRHYRIEQDAALNNGKFSLTFIFFGERFSKVPLLIFLSINPGVFIYLFSMFDEIAYAVILMALIATIVIFLTVKIKKYWSAKTYQLALAKARRNSAGVSSLGAGTPSHSSSGSSGSHNTSGSTASTNGSSASSSESPSSSGGGRSGGGGASSGW